MQDTDTLVSLLSDMYYYNEKDFVDCYFECNVDEDLDSFESSVRHSYSFTYEVNETYTLSDCNLDTLLDTIETRYSDFDVSAIKK